MSAQNGNSVNAQDKNASDYDTHEEVKERPEQGSRDSACEGSIA
jgi:hypothetical protein